MKTLRKFLREQNVDLVLAEYGVIGAEVWTACRDEGLPLVVHFFGYDAFHKRTLENYGEHYRFRRNNRLLRGKHCHR